jgi:hypothetical protein
MNGRVRTLALLFFLAAACAEPRPAPPQISRGEAIAVLPPNNRTGDPLLVSGASFLDRYAFHTETVTVGDVLAGEARAQLSERGFRVTPPEAVDAAAEGHVPRSPHAAAEIAAHGKLDGLALYLEILRWEPDAPVHTTFVIVGLSASLVDTASRNVVWQLYRQPEPIATPGEVTLESAYETAARKVMAEILSPFGAPQTAPNA